MKARASRLLGQCLRRLALHRSCMLPENDAKKQQLTWLSRKICASSEALQQAHEEDEVQAAEVLRDGRSDIDGIG